MMLNNILGLVLIILFGWLIYRTIKSQPQSFSKHNLGKSIFSLGILTLILIAFVVILAYIVHA